MASKWKKKEQRRKVLPGYPVEEPFKSIDEVRAYMEGDSIICLLCGKSYRKLGTHLATIHDMTVDDYKEKYKIPWTYGLICSESSERYSVAVVKRMEEGWSPPMKLGKEQAKMIGVEKRKSPFKAEIGIQNLGEHKEPKHPLTLSPTGELETYTARRARLTSKRGTDKFYIRMRSRPQCQPEVVGKRLGDYWRGRKQTPEHRDKRILHGMITRLKRILGDE